MLREFYANEPLLASQKDTPVFPDLRQTGPHFQAWGMWQDENSLVSKLLTTLQREAIVATEAVSGRECKLTRDQTCTRRVLASLATSASPSLPNTPALSSGRRAARAPEASSWPMPSTLALFQMLTSTPSAMSSAERIPPSSSASCRGQYVGMASYSRFTTPPTLDRHRVVAREARSQRQPLGQNSKDKN